MKTAEISRTPSSETPERKGSGLAVGACASEDTLRLWNNLEEMGLTTYAAELEIKGYAVVPPSVTKIRKGWVEDTRNAIFKVAERRHGVTVSRSEQDGGFGIGITEDRGFGLTMSHIMFEDPVFEEALLNPAALALAEVLVGRKGVISSSVGGLKGPGDSDLPLHTDALGLPAPFPSICPGINMTWALTPYTLDDGCLCVVPGSHKLFRHPLEGEGIEDRVAVEAEEGSLIMWGEYLWHGAFARRNKGIRANLITSLQRPHMRSKEAWDDAPPERLSENAPRFAELVRPPWGWRHEGPPADVFSYNVENAYD